MINSDRIDKISPRFATNNIRFFVDFFCYVLMAIPIFVLAFIAAYTTMAAALSPRVESFAVIRFRASSASILLESFREIFALRMSYVVPNRLMS